MFLDAASTRIIISITVRSCQLFCVSLAISLAENFVEICPQLFELTCAHSNGYTNATERITSFETERPPWRTTKTDYLEIGAVAYLPPVNIVSVDDFQNLASAERQPGFAAWDQTVSLRVVREVRLQVYLHLHVHHDLYSQLSALYRTKHNAPRLDSSS